MYPILISIFFYFQQLDCRQILSGKMINAILFIFYQEVIVPCKFTHLIFM